MTESEKPPVFDSWKSWYVLVLSVLFAQIVIYYLITRAFA
jgi:hypothetical protein